MTTLPQYRAAETLERFLGDPLVRDNQLSFARSVALDDRDAYPEEACARLAAWGFPAFFVPRALGGRLDAYDEQLALWRAVARRDLTVAVTQVISFIAATPVWVGGNRAQQTAVAALLAEGHQLSFALTERAHGSDLLASETAAVRGDDDTYQIDGEKWLIGNGQRSRALTLFARSAAAGGPAGFSMLLIDRAALRPGTCAALPRERTMGLRGMDLSGLRFTGARVPASAVLDAPGHGLEVLLKAQQIARLAICGLSLGAADTALRTTARFAADRVLYGERITGLPYVRDRLIGALLEIAICEAVLVAGFRGVHAAADQLALWTAVAKCVVPPRIDHVISELRLVLGARYHLRDGHADGAFQKVLRDHLILSVVEGSTAVNLKAIAMQLRGLARRAPRADQSSDPDEPARVARLNVVFRLDRALPAAALSELALAAGRDDIVQGVAGVLAQLTAEAAGATGATAEALAVIRALVEVLHAEIAALYREVAALPTRYGQAQRRAPELTKLAERYAVQHAAACCVHLWWHNRGLLDADATEGAWLALCLERLLRPLGRSIPALPDAWADRVLARLLDQLAGHRLFSLATVNLADEAALEEAMP
jgi:alkylation response protein AidB-like acyl-CoA dehydrogenase